MKPIERIVLVYRLREVVGQVPFTRFGTSGEDWGSNRGRRTSQSGNGVRWGDDHLPPVAVTVTEVSLRVTPLLLVTWIGEDMLVVVGETVKVAAAATPLLMLELLTPKSRHV
jgi:hypothetical protein